MRSFLILSLGLLSSCNDGSDMRCDFDAQCPKGELCFTVNYERIPDSDCQPNQGVRVCRPMCGDCSNGPQTYCGCQCR